MRFGSEELHLELRKACDSGDLDYAGTLLCEPVRRAARILFAKFRDHFSMYSPEDREDAVQNAQLYMLEHLQDLAYPPEEGTPCFSYYAHFVLSGLRKRRHKIIRDGKSDRLDAPVGADDGDDRQATRLDLLPSTAAQPDRLALVRDNLFNALRDFFQLQNDPATLTCVAYTILNETLGTQPMSLAEYADYFNGRRISLVLQEIEDILNVLRLDTSILDPVKKRLHTLSDPPRFSGVTEKKLANRKNSILKELRKRRDPED